MKRLLIALVTCALLPAALAADVTLKGKFTVDGKEVPLKHVLVLDFDDAEGMGEGPELRVLFSNAEVAQSQLESPILFNLDALAREGKLQGVLMRFDPKSESREVYGTTYVTPTSPQSSMPFFTLGGEAGGVDSLKVTDGALSGSVTASGTGDADFGLPAYSFEATFTAPVTKATPAKVFQGKDAMGKGDLDTVKKMTTPEKAKQMDDYIGQMGKEAFMEMAKQMVSDPATREKALKGLYIRGENTTIVFDDENGKMSVNLRKKGEVWIMD